MHYSNHSLFMERALALAARGGPAVRPNPLVGAVVVKDGRVIGEGYHQRYGEPHAEANALAACGDTADGATMYCTLEPCCFTDATKHQPPCTGAIIASGIKRLVIAQIDPNPKVSGRGVAQLRAAGIDVSVGICGRRAAVLNPGFNTEMAFGRPFVHVKWAQTTDGRIATATGDSRWITDEAARARAHDMRAESDAVLVGIGTVLADDPLLNVRSRPVDAQPRAVVLDTSLRIPVHSRLVRERRDELVLVTAADPASARAVALRRRGVEIIHVDGEVRDPSARVSPIGLDVALHALRERGVRRLFVEGGASVIGSFLSSGLYDRISVFTAPLVLGGGLPAASYAIGGAGRIAEADRLVDVSVETIGDQVLFDGFSGRWMDRLAPTWTDLRDGVQSAGIEEAHVHWTC